MKLQNKVKKSKTNNFQNDLKCFRNKVRAFILALCRTIIIVGISFLILSPLIKCLSNSFMDTIDTYNPMIYLIPHNFTLINYQVVMKAMQYGRSLAYTMIYVLGVTFIQLLISAMVGYGFARFELPFKKILFGLVILTIVVPVTTIMMPLYTQFRYFDFFGFLNLLNLKPLNLIDTPIPIIILSLTGMGLRSGLFIFIFRQFFRGLPKEIEEAATIDGAGTMKTFIQVMLPNAIPSIITVMLFSFVWQYNDTFYSSLLMSSKNLMAIKISSIGNLLHTASLSQYSPVLARDAAVLLTILPIIILYAIMQRFFIEGIERSGIVG